MVSSFGGINIVYGDAIGELNIVVYGDVIG